MQDSNLDTYTSNGAPEIKTTRVVYPQLYSYTLPDIPANDGSLKIGNTAQRMWMEAVLEDRRIDQREQILEDLSEYCRLDTWAMVRIWQELIILVKMAATIIRFVKRGMRLMTSILSRSLQAKDRLIGRGSMVFFYCQASIARTLFHFLLHLKKNLLVSVHTQQLVAVLRTILWICSPALRCS